MKFRLLLLLVFLMLSAAWTTNDGRQLRDAFAASSNTAKRFLLERKPFWSGVEAILVEGDLARALNLPQPTGVLVQRVAVRSKSWRLGINPGILRTNVEGADLLIGGDVILGVNGIQVTENNGRDGPIYNSIGAVKPRDSLVMKVFRQGQIIKLSIPVER